MEKAKRIPKKIRFQIYQNLYEIIQKCVTDSELDIDGIKIFISGKGITLYLIIGFGFCWYIRQLYPIYFPNRDKFEIYKNDNFKLLFPELYAKKPKSINSGYWGDNNWRLEVINEILAKEEIRKKTLLNKL